MPAKPRLLLNHQTVASSQASTVHALCTTNQHFSCISTETSAKLFVNPCRYVQEQVPVSYQTVNDLFCVRARYTPLDGSNPAKGLLVNNYANRGRVNGPAMGTSDSSGAIVRLVAMPAEPGKLLCTSYIYYTATDYVYMWLYNRLLFIVIGCRCQVVCGSI